MMEYPVGAAECDISDDVVETLSNLFGDTVSREVIIAVLESCDGNPHVAAEAIMNMSADAVEIVSQVPDNIETTHNTTPEPVQNEEITQNTQSSAQSSVKILSAPLTSVQDTTASDTVVTNQSTLFNQPLISDQPFVFAPPGQSPHTNYQQTLSYAGASKSAGAVPKQLPKLRSSPSSGVVWTDQLRQLMTNHNQGARILVLMRGVPGSGKSYLAKQIVEMMIGATYTDYRTHIFSTDDYFMVRGQYQYDRYKLSQAHDWNQNRVRLALSQGLSPVIVDNTNIEIWEMEPYLREGVKNGYIIEVLEPNTPWAKKVSQLMKRNSHNVPVTTIKRMLQNYQDGITGTFLIRHYGLSYPGDKVPPVMRSYPKFVSQVPMQPTMSVASTAQSDFSNSTSIHSQTNEENLEANALDHTIPQHDTNVTTDNDAIKLESESEEEELARQQRYTEIQKQLEEMEKVEQEWENGEGWEEELQETVSSSNEDSVPLEPRAPRRGTNSDSSEQSTPREKLLETVQNCDDWRKITMLMPPWFDDNSDIPKELPPEEFPVKEVSYRSSSTCIESGDCDIRNPNKIQKVVSTTPRDINIFYIPKKERIPDVRMLDKSSMTNELLITEAFKCKNEEQHFIAFRKLFKHIPAASLRDIFDKCCGDVNWAVDIVLEGMATNRLEISEGDISEDDETIPRDEHCNCLAAYHVIPDSEPLPSTNTSLQHTHSITASENNTSQKKSKASQSETAMQLKRDIEKNVVISDEHYSDNALKIRKWRRGEKMENPKPSTEQRHDIVQDVIMESQPSTSNTIGFEYSRQVSHEAAGLSDEEESNTSSLDDAERTVNVNLGYEFIAQLDNFFGRRGMTYPENIQPKVNIPISLLNEINAFWIESLMCQLDEQDKQKEQMIKEDAEFARQLQMKEAELARQGKEPEVPDFKEIMDMDFAISLYQKDVAEWKSKEPNDIAAKLTRDKLFNLFPDMCPDILSELLMAHDNNFQATVEVLLMSTGKAHILEEKNGLNKFVIEKEMKRQEKLLEEQKKALSEVEWPLLPKGEKIEMSTVNNFRDEAEKHLIRRNQNYHKAQEYVQRGMTQVAAYYSELATFHTSQYEHCSSLAAASLMQVHAANTPDNVTIDLHYLRVAEAKESLDIFLDRHIQKMRANTGSNRIRYLILYLITGRGLHSNDGRPRVKPAIKKRLRERGLWWQERNPGLLTTRLTADDKLTHQVQAANE